jgi:probable F420-dependent oxidoreductase
MTHKFRFGVQGKSAASGKEWAEQARKCEDLGYSVLGLPDHFDNQLAPTVGMTAAAGATTTLRVGALVWCNDYRHPVTFAAEMSTLDLLSDGRLELGIGAGWMKADYEQAGMTYDRPGVRIERMIEAVDVMKGLFGDGAFSFEGEHYNINEMDLLPKPLQKPHPPFLIGGGGPRMLRTAGRLADIVGVNANLASGVIDTSTISDAVAERFVEKIGWVKDGAGDRFDQIELNIRTFFVVFTDNPEESAAAMAPGLGMEPAQALESPLALIGDTSRMADVCRERREKYGFSYVTVGAGEIEEFAPVVAELAGT